LDEAAELFERTGDLVQRARVDWYRSRLFAHQGDLHSAIVAAQSAVIIADRSGDARTIGLAHHGLGNIHRRLRQTGSAIEEFEIGRRQFKKANDPEMLAVAMRRLGSVRMDEGELGQALLDLESSTDQLRSLGLLSEAAESAVLHAQVLAKLGEIRDAALERDIATVILEPLGSTVRNNEIAEVTRLIGCCS
jgi:tetratricopeptide (TPR) repeat protein